MNTSNPAIKVFGPKPWGPAVYSDCEYVGKAPLKEACFDCKEKFEATDSGLYIYHGGMTKEECGFKPWHRECEMAHILPHPHPHPKEWEQISRHERAKMIVENYELSNLIEKDEHA